ncbi:MAG TPA: PQQ-binding-like beta-propeller repeat protein [Ignavibacteria bacterium]|nr:PQQ-binding-like beta-propeller repeat protein [Ignavibacteria bacterium]
MKIKDNISIDENFDWLQRGRTVSNFNSGNGLITENIKQIWSFNADGGFSKNAMLATDGVLFASTLRGETFGINILNGKGLGRFGKTGGGVNCPSFYKGNLIITFDGNEDASALRYDLKSGEVKWRLNFGMVKSAPTVENEFIYITSKDSSIYKINFNDGSQVWKLSSGTDKERFDQFISTPVISNQLLFAVTSKGILVCVDKNSGNVNWIKKTGLNILSDISVDGENIYLNSENGNILCYDFSGNLTWEKKFETSFTSSFAFLNENILVSGIDGYLYNLKKINGDMNWKFKTNGALYSNPVVYDNKVFLSSFDKHLYIIDSDTGEKIWSMKFESRLRTAPLVWRNYLFVACDNREIYCFEFLK